MDWKVYLFARKPGVLGTKIMEIEEMKAIEYLEANYDNDLGIDLGILSGDSFGTVRSVYGEYAPFKKVNSLDELMILK